MKQTKEFMLLFRYEPSNQKPTQEQLTEIQKLWGEFIGGITMQGNLIRTHQLGLDGKMVFPDLSTEERIHISGNQIISRYMILKTESLESATELAKNSPILKMGGTAEVRSIITMS